jgi:DNA-binding CsgD family transcriptional regulator
LEVALLETEARPLYQQAAQTALHLRELGLSYSTIARRLEVDDKTVAKAVRWLRRMRS